MFVQVQIEMTEYNSVLILSLVIAFGIMLGKIKVAGISLGVTDRKSVV